MRHPRLFFLCTVPISSDAEIYYHAVVQMLSYYNSFPFSSSFSYGPLLQLLHSSPSYALFTLFCLTSLCSDVSQSLRCFTLAICFSLRSSSVVRILAAPFAIMYGTAGNTVTYDAFGSILTFIAAVAAAATKDCTSIMMYSSC